MQPTVLHAAVVWNVVLVKHQMCDVALFRMCSGVTLTTWSSIWTGRMMPTARSLICRTLSRTFTIIHRNMLSLWLVAGSVFFFSVSFSCYFSFRCSEATGTESAAWRCGAGVDCNKSLGRSIVLSIVPIRQCCDVSVSNCQLIADIRCFELTTEICCQ